MTAVTGPGNGDQGIPGELRRISGELLPRQGIGDLVPVLVGYAAWWVNVHLRGIRDRITGVFCPVLST
ncbi:hypothetical protein ACIQF6_25485 [Kitasatospora sp. NPDC092948]|uniref:hypothetical protein n=1 Tax=Kitasatospora sp. NPDC092948 TaxID=3364088 RepID=UPI0037F3A7C2